MPDETAMPDPTAPALPALLRLWQDRDWEKLERAARAYLAQHPDAAKAWTLLGSAQRQLGRPAEAAASHRACLALEPQDFDAHVNLGNALLDLGEIDDAIAVFAALVRFRNQDPRAYFYLGLALNRREAWDEAIAALQQGLRLKPDYAEAYNDLGVALAGRGAFAASGEAFATALRYDASLDRAYLNLAYQLLSQARHAEALPVRRVILARQPGNPAAWRGYLNHLNYLPEATGHDILAAHCAAHAALSASLPPPNVTCPNVPDPARRLKVGYVSGDLRRHSCAWFLEPLLRSHDREAVEVLCYSNVERPDHVTERLRALADEWRDIRALGDEAVAEAVRADAVDLLVDCSGWTLDGRLPVFEARPAPIQLSWLGYPATTGFPSLQYRLTDAIADPPGETDAFHVEQLVRLPQGFLCYQAASDAPVVGVPPSAHSGRITFGSFNAMPKLNEACIAVWSKLLRAVPDSRLLLKAEPLADKATAERIRAAFVASGVASDRLELRGWSQDVTHHLAQYGEIDIALDPFPYNGTTTSCEALWMGVPVVTLCGARHAARVGASLLTQIGHAELIATDAARYVSIAADLARDADRLAALRAALRGDMARSSLCDAAGFARRLESTYRTLWRAWCEGRPQISGM